MAADDLSLLGQAQDLHQAGRLGEAEAGYRSVLALNPKQPDALHLLGLVALQKGNAEKAADLIGRAIGIDRKNPLSQMHMGLAFSALERFEEGEKHLRRAVELAPEMGDAALNLGQLLLTTGRHAEAARQFRKAARVTPGDPRPLNGEATALIADGHMEEAEEPLRKALEAAPDFDLARANLVNLLADLDRAGEAEVEVAPLLAANPDNPDALYVKARVLRRLERQDEAIALYRRALPNAPEPFPFKVGLGAALMEAGRADEAADIYRPLARTDPGNRELHKNLGLALKAAGDLEGAISAFGEVLAGDGEAAEMRYIMGLTRMTEGDFAGGLDDYENRWRKVPPDTPWRDFPQDLWDGGDVAGKRLLVWAEQGVGDHILFAGLLPLLVAKGGATVFECDPRLVPIIQRAFTGIKVIAEDDDPGLLDLQVPMGSLMRCLAPWPNGFQPLTGYLSADDRRVSEIGGRLDALGTRPRIGISWRSARTGVGPLKTIALDQWAAVLELDALFVNLQYGETDAEIAAAGAPIHSDPEIDRFDDLEGMMALIDSLDLVITTSNVTAHYAGALGKECWLMAQKTPLWYWGRAGAETLFYPSVRAYRQRTAGQWDDVIAAVAGDLREYLQS